MIKVFVFYLILLINQLDSKPGAFNLQENEIKFN